MVRAMHCCFACKHTAPGTSCKGEVWRGGEAKVLGGFPRRRQLCTADKKHCVMQQLAAEMSVSCMIGFVGIVHCISFVHHLMHILPRMDMEHHQSCADCLVTGVNNINHKSNIWEYQLSCVRKKTCFMHIYNLLLDFYEVLKEKLPLAIVSLQFFFSVFKRFIFHVSTLIKLRSYPFQLKRWGGKLLGKCHNMMINWTLVPPPSA